MKDNELAPGGTAWAIAMFRHLHPGNCDIFVFDQVRESWFQFDGEKWEGIERPPRPTGIWAGIGARELQQCGRDAIRKVMGGDEVKT